MDKIHGKMDNSLKLIIRYRLILVLIIYILFGIFLLKYYQYQINTDGIRYIYIANLYLTDQWGTAIDAYWGPLISWLLIPFLYFSHTPVNELISTKILSLIIGFFTIIGVKQLSYRFEMDETIRTSILFILIPIILYFAYSVFTPDLLIVCLLVFYLSIIFNPNYPEKLSNGIFCGILGALSFLGKSYLFPFFIATFIIFNLFHYFKGIEQDKRKKVIKNLFIGFIIFFIISGVWILLISQKEGKITIGTSGEVNYGKVGPLGNIIADGNPNEGITQKFAYNSSYTPYIYNWSPFKSWNNFKLQLKIIFKNTKQLISILNSFSYLSIIILISCILLCIPPTKKLLSESNILYSLVTIAIYAGGYLPILLEERYLWIIYILLILMGGYLINLMFKWNYFPKKKFSGMIKTIVILLFAFSFIIMPLNYLVQNIHTDENIYNLSETLMKEYGIHGNLASNTNHQNAQFISFYTKAKYLGEGQENVTDNELKINLNKLNIDYYFVWGYSPNSKYLDDNYKELTNGTINGLKIYSINEG